ncbi:MAG TPA: hypothetical protein VHW71_08020 [Steroidobacteraceae bacterium]|jgi:hypothetical protein|nr:hypothetical protein [Steroidobacteraceae bacterium]
MERSIQISSYRIGSHRYSALTWKAPVIRAGRLIRAHERIAQKTIQRLAATTVLLISTTTFAAQVPQETPSAAGTLPRIDAPVTPANSVLYDFGYGAILRVPKILFPDSAIPKDPNEALHFDRLSLVFEYPEMVQTTYPSLLDLVMQRDSGHYVPTPDRFAVLIPWLFYFHGEFGDTSVEYANKGPDWRPQRMFLDLEARVRYQAKLHHIPDAKVTLIDSRNEGLREVHAPVTDKAYHDRLVKKGEENGYDYDSIQTIYVERAVSPYELYMICQNPDVSASMECKAYVYMKSNHFQYRMIFPSEAVAHTDSLVRTINTMVDGWLQK